MKILVITQYFYPETFRINDIVSELVKRGHDVTVVTGLPNYPKGEIYPGYEDSYKTISNYFGAKVYRCNLRPRYQGSVNLLRNYLSFVINANKVLKKINDRFDIIYVYGLSPITIALPAIKYKKKHSVPIFYYCLDIWPESVRDAQNGHKLMSKRNPIFIVSKIISKYIYKRCDLIATKCNEFIEYINSECKINKSKMKLLYEHAENLYLKVADVPKNNGIIDFMFLGNIGAAQNCDLIIKAYSNIRNLKMTHLHFVGDGSELQRIKTLVSNLNLNDYVTFYGHQSLEKVVDYYNLADVCILTLSNASATGLTPPSKLLSYMASARPIIASIGGSAKTIITNARCGYICPSSSVDSMTAIMEKAIISIDEMMEFGRNGREYFIENFTLEKHINNLVKEMDDLVKSFNC